MNKTARVRTSSLFAQVATPLVAVPFSVILGGWLVATATAALASPGILMAQTVVERLPPPPPTPDSEKELPPPPIFVPREFDFQAPAANTPPAVNNANTTNLSYLVYVDDPSSPTLERVKQLEPQAFVRQYNGRSVVQAGAFARSDNAQQRAQELKSAGVAARIVDLSTGTDTAFVGNTRAYFVVIPDRQENLAAIADQIRQLQQNATVEGQLQPRGAHVRVGPFPNRSLAEQWNQYFLNAGLRNARVYYGR